MIGWLNPRRQLAPPRYPASPSGVTLYAVGDVHGRIDCLQRAQAAIDRDRSYLHRSQRALEIYVGDYIDRGPASPAVIDNLIARAAQTELVTLRGNHEILMTSFLSGELAFEQWRGLGGLETVMAYGVSPLRLRENGWMAPSDLAARAPPAHLAFLASLQTHFVCGPYCFVHAGLRPGVPLAQQAERDFAWIRGEFLDYRGGFEHIIVHGHTPVRDIEFHPFRINIDTGAYLSNKLSVLCIDQSGPAALREEVE